MTVEPAEGYVAIEPPEAGASDGVDVDAPPGDDVYRQLVLVECVGVGKKVTRCKKGDAVFVRRWAIENASTLPGGVALVEEYAVLGTVTKD